MPLMTAETEVLLHFTKPTLVGAFIHPLYGKSNSLKKHVRRILILFCKLTLGSSIMVSDRRQFNRAMKRWDELHGEGRFSAPDSEGAVGILVAHAATTAYEIVGQGHGGYDAAAQIHEFDTEAAELAAKYEALGRACLVRVGIDEDAFREVLQNPDVSTVIVIGNGNLTSVAMGAEEGNMTWLDVADAATHLKTGSFIQRMCGTFLDGILPVPIGMFAVRSHTQVIAPVRKLFLPAFGNREFEEAKLQPVFGVDRAEYEDVRNLNTSTG